jgi:FixJ family two-component response regulator
MNADHDAQFPEKKCHIAVVDDEPEVCKSLRRLLRSVGFDVSTFPSGQDFLHSLRQQRPDCLVLDLHLPGLTGLDVQHHLVATGMSFPVVVITGRDEPGLKERVLATGAAAFLLKPVDETELLGAIRNLPLNLSPGDQNFR